MWGKNPFPPATKFIKYLGINLTNISHLREKIAYFIEYKTWLNRHIGNGHTDSNTTYYYNNSLQL